MNIVVLTGPYNPIMSPSSSCIAKYLFYLKKDYNVHVVSQLVHLSTVSREDDGITFHYVSNWHNSLRSRCNERIANNKASTFDKFILFLLRLYGVFLSTFSYPTRISWIRKEYFKALRDINTQIGIDVIISVSNPVCAHIAALRYKRIYPHVKWITFSTDPFTYYPAIYENILFKKQRKKRNFITEKEIYDVADANIFTEELFEYTQKTFYQPQNKTYCFPYVLSDFTEGININKPQSSFIKLIYAGALNKKIRNPEFALSVLSVIPGIEADFFQAGDCDDLFDSFKDTSVRKFGLVNRDEYLDLICNKADVLINIANNSILQAPSKMLELISTGRPIVNFYVEKNSQYKMIEKYPLGINVCKQDNNPVEMVSEFCKKNKGKRLTSIDVSNLFPENSLQIQLRRLYQIINNK